MPNPLVAQGTLNRLRGSVNWSTFPQLNVTAPYLGKEGIKLALEGEVTHFIDTMTGAVTSPEPYQRVSITMNLLKTQGLSDQYKQQMEANALLGDGTVKPDATTLGTYSVFNCSIQAVRELSFAGDDAGFVVTCMGYYNINADLYNI